MLIKLFLYTCLKGLLFILLEKLWGGRTVNWVGCIGEETCWDVGGWGGLEIVGKVGGGVRCEVWVGCTLIIHHIVHLSCIILYPPPHTCDSANASALDEANSNAAGRCGVTIASISAASNMVGFNAASSMSTPSSTPCCCWACCCVRFWVFLCHRNKSWGLATRSTNL